jgi:hypothetical protein
VPDAALDFPAQPELNLAARPREKGRMGFRIDDDRLFTVCRVADVGAWLDRPLDPPSKNVFP